MAEPQPSVAGYLAAAAEVLRSIDPAPLQRVVGLLLEAWEQDRTVFLCGNGGSASTASHMACDLTKQTLVPTRRPLRALSLTDNTELLSAWGNDAGFTRVFAEQLRTHGRNEDLLVCLSCSGNSPNIMAAVDQAHRLDMRVVGMGGFDGGRLAQDADVYVHIPAYDYGHVESAHLVIDHLLTALLRDAVEGPRSGAANGRQPLVIIDRDGVINRNLDDGVRSWDEFEFLPGALEGIAALTRAGHQVAVVTNQANIGRGCLTRAQLEDIHRRMLTEIIAVGGVVEAIFVCEHRPEDGCQCRKPAPGLLLQAARELDSAIDKCYFIGDHSTDVLAARAAGAKPVLVLSGRERGDDTNLEPQLVAHDLHHAVQLIGARSNGVQAKEGKTQAGQAFPGVSGPEVTPC